MAKEGVDLKTFNSGTCPLCSRDGKIGMLCLPCSRDQGMIIGSCPKCKQLGEQGKPCKICGPLFEPRICFMAQGGDDSKTSNKGICPGCRRKDKIGILCLPCSKDQGMLAGSCPGCQERGELGQPCKDCAGTEYEEVGVSMGECFHCKGTGVRGNLCDDCEDMSYLYE